MATSCPILLINNWFKILPGFVQSDSTTSLFPYQNLAYSAVSISRVMTMSVSVCRLTRNMPASS